MKLDLLIVTAAVILGLATGTAVCEICLKKLASNKFLWSPHPSMFGIESMQGQAHPEHLVPEFRPPNEPLEMVMPAIPNFKSDRGDSHPRELHAIAVSRNGDERFIRLCRRIWGELPRRESFAETLEIESEE